MNVKPPNANAAAVWGNRALARPDVQARIKELRAAVSENVRRGKENVRDLPAREAAVSKVSVVADVTEVLTTLSEQMRGTTPWRVRQTKTRTGTGANAVEHSQQSIVMERGLAASRILDHFDGVGVLEDSGQHGDIRAAVLIVLSNKEDRRAFDAIAAKTIDVRAKVVPKVPPANGHAKPPSKASSNGNGSGR